MRPSRVPASSPNVTVRLARDAQDLDAANQLVLRKYAEQGYWSNDEHKLDQNQHLQRASRRVFVMVDGQHVLATISIIVDSPDGLPADTFRRETIDRLRAHGEKVAEVSALAFDRSSLDQLRLFHVLGAFMFQYSFYYAGIDHLVAVCTPTHARFYSLYYRMQPEGESSTYGCIDVDAQMLTLNLHEAHRQAAMTPRSDRSCAFQRFLHLDEHAAFRFPDGESAQRPRSWGTTFRYRTDLADAAEARLSGVGG